MNLKYLYLNFHTSFFKYLNRFLSNFRNISAIDDPEPQMTSHFEFFL
jgi:hypothetical protein